MTFADRLRRTELPRRLLGAVLSVFVPGAGHIVLGYATLGWVIAGLTLMVGAGVVVAVLQTATGVFLALGALLILSVVGSVVSIFALPPGPRLKDGARALWPVLVLFVVFRGGTYLVGIVIEAYRMPSMAMLPLIAEGDLVFAVPRPSQVGVAEVVVFTDPHGADLYMGRVVATGGQRVRYAAGALYVDGKRIEEIADGELTVREQAAGQAKPTEHVFKRFRSSIAGRSFAVLREPDGHSTPDVAEVQLAPEQVYVVDDNREHGVDSRSFGPVTQLKARASFVASASGLGLDGRGRIWQRLWSPGP